MEQSQVVEIEGHLTLARKIKKDPNKAKVCFYTPETSSSPSSSTIDPML